MPEGLPIRRAVRALVIDPADRLLLVRFGEPARHVWWAMPGGGVESGEDEVDALRRELAEEVGLVDVDLAGPIWERTHLWEGHPRFAGQAERMWFVRCATFDPAPQMSWDQLNAEGMTGIRWWTTGELAAAIDTDFSPTRLPTLFAGIVADGPPTTVIDVGV